MKYSINYDNNFVGYKLRLFPTKQQEKLFYDYFKICRYVYNLGINIVKKNYEKSNKFIGFFNLNKEVNKLKNTDEYKWLRNYDATTLTIILNDVNTAYERFFDKSTKYPKYKNKYKTKKQFPVRHNRMMINSKTVKLQTFGEIKYCNSYGDSIIGTGDNRKKSIKNIDYKNARISFDGINFYLSFTIPKDKNHNVNNYDKYLGNSQWQKQESSNAIGIDVGIKNKKWIKDSAGEVVERPDNTILYNKIHRFQKKLSRQRNINRLKNSSFDEQHPNGSKNMQKTKEKINKYYKKITNRRRNKVYEYANSLLKKKPKAIVMENISPQEFIDRDDIVFNKNIMNRNIYDAALFESMAIIEKKMINNGITVIRADTNYPSSQICSCCGHIQNIGRKQIYKCPNCGTIIDRDFNAAINLSRLAYN